MFRQNTKLAALLLALGVSIPSGISAQAVQQIPLVVVLWKDVNFHGTKRTLVEDTPNLTRQDFNDATSSVAIHPGPNYAAWKQANGGREPTITLFVDSGGRGTSINLRAGLYPNLHSRGLGDKISSVYFSGATGRAIAPSGQAAPFNFIPIVVKLYTDAHWRGHELTLVESTRDIKGDFGNRFQDSISSATLAKGPNYSPGRGAELCIDNYFDQCFFKFPDQGGMHDFGGVFPDDPRPLQDSISSVRIR